MGREIKYCFQAIEFKNHFVSMGVVEQACNLKHPLVILALNSSRGKIISIS